MANKRIEEMKCMMDCGDDPEVLKYVEMIEGILNSVRALEHKLVDTNMSYDLFENEIIQVKLCLKAIKKNIYAIG